MPTSRAQVRLAHAVLEGKTDKLPRGVAQDFVDAVHGHKLTDLPDHSKKGKRPFPRKRKQP